MPKKKTSVGQSIGGILVGFDQLAPVAAAGGGTMRVGMPGDPAPSSPTDETARRAVSGPIGDESATG